VKDHFVRQREERHWKSQQSRQPVITDSPVESAITTLHASPFVPELEPSLAELTVCDSVTECALRCLKVLYFPLHSSLVAWLASSPSYSSIPSMY
jgi:hypothetical protein